MDGWMDGTQFINHANCKITDLNVMDWANDKNTYSPFFPLTSMRCTKTILRPGMASYRKSLLAA